jgi:hypothetical protein
MNSNALTLITWLEEKYREAENYGYSIEHMGNELGWSYSKTRYVIDWCRNRMMNPRYMIHTFHRGNRWYYKKPTQDEALIYEKARGQDVAVRAGHVLLLARKRAAEFGVTRETRKTSNAYQEVLAWLREAGVADAETILAQSLQDLTNGHHPAV